MPLLSANVPEIRQGLFSPGLKKFGQGVAQMASEYGGRLSEVASLPGRVYKGEVAPTPENAFEFASTFTGGGMATAGKGGLGMGGRRLIGGREMYPQKLVAQRSGSPSVSLSIKNTIPDEEAILGRLSDVAKSQYKIGQSKFLKNQIDELTGQFQKQAIEYGSIPKTSFEALSIADEGLTKTAAKIAEYRKLLGAMDKNWI